MQRRNELLVGAAWLALAISSGQASGQETTTYQYDELGQLTKNSFSGGPNNGRLVGTCFDRAGNRVRYDIAIGTPASCAALPPAPLPAPTPTPTPTPTPIPPSQPDGIYTVPSGARIDPDHFYRSSDGRFNFIMQSDGNLVLKKNGNSIWSSNTAYAPGAYATMQNDGKLVIYMNGQIPVWASGSSGVGAYLRVQNDGNVVIYRTDNSVAWTTNTCCQ